MPNLILGMVFIHRLKKVLGGVCILFQNDLTGRWFSKRGLGTLEET